MEKTPTRPITHAVKGMLPKNAMGRRMLSRLKIYAGGDHPHQAQLAATRGSEDEATPGKTKRKTRRRN